jgi:hypothetical protein
MEQRNDALREEDSKSRKREAPMETQTVQPTSEIAATKTCVHGRLIDDVLTRNGKRTGKVRCVECGVKFDDPYYGLK